MSSLAKQSKQAHPKDAASESGSAFINPGLHLSLETTLKLLVRSLTRWLEKRWRGLWSNNLSNPYIIGSVVPSIVGLVVVKAINRANAMTVSFFSEVAHHPTSLWVSIAKTSYTHTLLNETGRFSLIVLNQTQPEVALTCGSISGRDQDKCAALSLYPGPEGYLFLNGALASTACSVRQAIPIGDHTLYIADILHSEIESRKSHLRQLLLSDL